MKHNEEFADFLRDHVNLNQGRIEELDQHVKAVTSYLRNNLAGFRRVEYQGSRALGTIIRPVKDRHEFDADLLVIVDKDGNAPKPYSDNLWDTLKDSDRYKEKIELWNRCVKLKYQGQCHLDTVPCVEDDGKQYVCPRNDDDLEEADGTGFRDWFNDQNRITKPESTEGIPRRRSDEGCGVRAWVGEDRMPVKWTMGSVAATPGDVCGPW